MKYPIGMVYNASVALKRAANGRNAKVSIMENPKPIGGELGSAMYRMTDMKATRVRIPVAVETTAHFGCKCDVVLSGFPLATLLAIRTAA